MPDPIPITIDVLPATAGGPLDVRVAGLPAGMTGLIYLGDGLKNDDGSLVGYGWPPGRFLAPRQPGNYVGTLEVGGESYPFGYTVGGVLSVTARGERVVLSEDETRRLYAPHGVFGTDNQMGMSLARYPNHDRIDYYHAGLTFPNMGSPYPQITRTEGDWEGPWREYGEVHHAPILGSPIRTEGEYLMAGPTYTVPEDLLVQLGIEPGSSMEIMHALTGRDLPGGTYGTNALLCSENLGGDWYWAGEISRQPVSYEQVLADPFAYLGNGGNSAINGWTGQLTLVLDMDRDGIDYLVTTVVEAIRPVFGPAGQASNYNPFGLVRLPLRETVARCLVGQSVTTLVEKLTASGWVRNHAATGVPAAPFGGPYGVQIYRHDALDRWIAVGVPSDQRLNTVWLSWADQIVGPWSDPATVFHYRPGQRGRVLFNPQFVAPDGVLYGDEAYLLFSSWAWEDPAALAEWSMVTVRFA